MQKRWLVNTTIDSTTVEEFRSVLKVDEVIAELLLQRGIDSFDSAQNFFRPDINDLHDPFLMKGMKNAVERLQEAIENQERILLFGDYDVDGTTAVAMMYSFLKDTAIVDYYIPDRYKEGYGLSKEGIDFASDHDVDLIISLDCGIKSVEHIAYARAKGIDFIVCDHHTPGSELPNAIVLDPKRDDCNYPYDELSGCGVGFKLLQGLCDFNNWSYDSLFELLDFLAISIGADIVPVTGENRILAFHGMKRLNDKPRKAFQELLLLANKPFPVTLTDVVFTIAPRINAAGRLRSGRFAVDLMISDDIDEIDVLAEEINMDNSERRLLDKEMTEEALEKISSDSDYETKVTTVVFDDKWHKGVVGIVASRLIETHYRPTVVLTQANGMITGSARSVQGFDVYEAILECEDILEEFGGHKYAAGLSMKKENLNAFKIRFEKSVRDKITSELLVPEQKIDLNLSFNQIFTKEENRLLLPRLKRILSQFEPHGPGNMKPVFTSNNVFTTDARVLKDAHLKLAMTQPTSDLVIEGIGFNMAEKMDTVASGLPFQVAYTLESNKWNGKETVQLNIKDIREMI